MSAVVYGVPAWARGQLSCPAPAGYDIFCVPNNASDYGRFVSLMAHRYNGQNGHGRVVDFVVMNEVTSNDWFNVGCGQSSGVSCDRNLWLDKIGACYNAAYDAVVTAQGSDARVLISVTHHFDTVFDVMSGAHPTLSAKSVLKGIDARAGSRKWRVALHPYPPDLIHPAFSPDDINGGRCTYGSLGALQGWIMQQWPTKTHAHIIQLTESGINSLEPYTNEHDQAIRVCETFINVLGTPGIENYVYHRMCDNSVETAAGLGLGLRRADSTQSAKPAWSVWALCNRNDLSPPQLSCGFEYLPYTRLARSYDSSRGHWASSRIPPDGFKEERAWYLLRESATNGTHMLYECLVGKHNLISTITACENLVPMGPVGFAYDAPGDGLVALHRCYNPNSGDHMVSSDAECEGYKHEEVLGYVKTA